MNLEKVDYTTHLKKEAVENTEKWLDDSRNSYIIFYNKESNMKTVLPKRELLKQMGWGSQIPAILQWDYIKNEIEKMVFPFVTTQAEDLDIVENWLIEKSLSMLPRRSL